MATYSRHPTHPYSRPTSSRPGPMPPASNQPYIDVERHTSKTERDATTPPAESPARAGFHPLDALKIAGRSGCFLGACTNVLWPAVPIGLVLNWAKPEWHLWVFIMNYIAMVPTANLLAFSSKELCQKIPRVLGVVVQTTVAAGVEIILCLLLLFKGQYQVIQAALLGSMLANLLLCIGLCFCVGGIRTKDQEFSEALTETGGGILLLSVAGLMLPAAFDRGVSDMGAVSEENLASRVLGVSRYTSILLLVAFGIYLVFQLHTHHYAFDRALSFAHKNNKDREDNAKRLKLTTIEALVFVAIALTLVVLHAVFMVEQIRWIVMHRNVSDAFMGLILVPLVEKAAEHLSAIDEAWDDAMDFALSHLLGSTVQTALFVAPIIVIVGWIAERPLDLNFEVFMVVALVFAVLVVGNFIKDRKSNWLEGALCVIFYIMIAIATWFYPNPKEYLAESKQTGRLGPI